MTLCLDPPRSTLSFAGSGVFARMARPLDAVVIDEAAQAVEPSTLIPLTLGIKQVHMKTDAHITIAEANSTLKISRGGVQHAHPSHPRHQAGDTVRG